MEDLLLTRESLKYLYCNEDFTTLYLFYPEYKEYDENGNEICDKTKEGKRVLKEFIQNNNIELIKKDCNGILFEHRCQLYEF